MATSAVTQLRELEEDELAARLKEAKEQLFTLRFQQATGQLDNFSSLKSVKRDIARIHTVLQERELGIDTTTAPSATEKDK
jgi:large subunit ribosomal protein L29